MSTGLIGRDAELAAAEALLRRALDGRGGALTLRGEAGIGKSALAEEIARRPQALGLRVTTGRAWEFAEAPPPQEPIERARRAMARARATGDDAVILDTLFFAGSALSDYAPLDECRAVSREIQESALRAGDQPRALAALARLVMDAAAAGDFDAYDRELDEMLALARRLGHPRLQWRALLMGSMRALARGDLAESDRLVVEVEQFAALSDDPALATSLTAHQFARLRIMHRDQDLISQLGSFRALVGNMPNAQAVAGAYAVGAHAWVGDREGAAAALAKLPVEHELYWSDGYFASLVSEGLALAGSDELRRMALERLRPYRDLELVSGHVPMTCEGPSSRVLGQLHRSLGDLAGAERELRRALASVRRPRFRTWVARIAWELAVVLDEAGRAAEAAPLYQEVASLARELGLTSLAERVAKSRGARPAPLETPRARPALTLSREGDVWAVGVDGRTLRVKDSRGLALLARLVDRPDEEIHVLALASDEGAVLADGDAGETIDADAARTYRERLRDLDEELGEAEANADRGRIDELRGERDFLESELSRGVGLRGARRAGSASERARVNVQRRLKDAIKRLGEADPATRCTTPAACTPTTTATWRSAISCSAPCATPRRSPTSRASGMALRRRWARC